MLREGTQLTRGFEPGLGTSGGHVQTLLGELLRWRLAWSLPTEDLFCAAEPDGELLIRASWQDGPRSERPLLLVVHGLGGSDASAYGLATGQLAFARGWHVARMNMRASGDGLGLCPRLYNAGLDADLLAIVRRVAEEARCVAMVGFSLGANLTLLTLARRRSELPKALVGAVAISAPLDLAECVTALERAENRLYQLHYVRKLKRAYRRCQRLRPDLYEAGREQPARTLRAFDAQITAPYGGYRDVDDYYGSSSAGPLLREIALPSLILSGGDDPMIPRDSVERWTLPSSGPVRREIVPTGGHVGFVAPSDAPGRFWAAERALGFLDDLLAG